MCRGQPGSAPRGINRERSGPRRCPGRGVERDLCRVRIVRMLRVEGLCDGSVSERTILGVELGDKRLADDHVGEPKRGAPCFGRRHRDDEPGVDGQIEHPRQVLPEHLGDHICLERRSEQRRDLQHLLCAGAELTHSTTHNGLHTGRHGVHPGQIAVAHQADHFADEERVAAGARVDRGREMQPARRATERCRLRRARRARRQRRAAARAQPGRPPGQHQSRRQAVGTW